MKDYNKIPFDKSIYQIIDGPQDMWAIDLCGNKASVHCIDDINCIEFDRFSYKFIDIQKKEYEHSGILFVLEFYCTNKPDLDDIFYYKFLSDIKDIIDICSGYHLHKQAMDMMIKYEIC